MKGEAGNNKNQWSLMNRIRSFGYAFQGLVTAIKTEPNLVIHLIAAVAISALGCYVELDTSEWIILTLTISIVIATELFNTALEYLADHVAPEKHPMVKACKDISSAAVLVVCLAAVIIGAFIFVPKFV